MEDQILNKYNPVRVFSNATILAALTMFFVMLMGLIGYTTDEVRRRSKEIAIRKVNGAESLGILELLSIDVLYVAAPAVIIGIISAAYINGMWMDQFAEQVPLSWPVYIDSISYPVTYPRLRHLEVMADSERKSGKQY